MDDEGSHAPAVSWTDKTIMSCPLAAVLFFSFASKLFGFLLSFNPNVTCPGVGGCHI